MKDKFQNISDKIRELLKNSPIEDIENNINALIKNKCTDLGLVSREEFDVQTEVLRKTREKLEAMEKPTAPPHILELATVMNVLNRQAQYFNQTDTYTQ